MTVEPEKRPSADELLAEPFIKKSQGKKFLSDLVGNCIDAIEESREKRAKSYPETEKPEAEPAHVRRLKESNNDSHSNARYEFNETGTTKIRVDPSSSEHSQNPSENSKQGVYFTNESGTMIIKKSETSSNKNSSGLEEDYNTGSIVYRKDAGDGQSPSEFEAYMEMLRELNQKYKPDKNTLEEQLQEICQRLTFSQRTTGMEVFTKKRDSLKAELEAELNQVRSKYVGRISDIETIIDLKQHLDLLRSQFKELGQDIDQIDCMKDIGEKSKMFRKEGTFEIQEPPQNSGHGQQKLMGVDDKAALGGQFKRLGKIGEKFKPNLQQLLIAEDGLQGLGSKLRKMNSSEKNLNPPSSRGLLSKHLIINPQTGAGGQSLTPKGAVQGLEKKITVNPSGNTHQLSSKNLLGKKPLVAYLADKGKVDGGSDKNIQSNRTRK